MSEYKEILIEGLKFDDLMKIIEVAKDVHFSCISVRDSRSYAPIKEAGEKG